MGAILTFRRGYSEVYDALYQDKDYESEASYICETLAEFGLAANPKILEVGMGTGKHAQILRNMIEGSTFLGIEPSLDMAEQAISRGLDVLHGDATTVMPSLERQSFDCLLALFHVASYIAVDASIDLFFTQAASCLRPHGLLFFDVWHQPAVASIGMSRRKKTVLLPDGGKVERVATPSLDLGNSQASVTYKIKIDRPGKNLEELDELHVLRFFTPAEVKNALTRAGFELVETHEFLSRLAPSTSTWGVTYVARLI